MKLGTEILGAISVDRPFSKKIDFSEDVRFLTIIASMIAQTVKIKRITEDEEQLLSENIKLKD